MSILLIIFNIIVSFLLVVVVLLQAGKGGGLAGSIGGGMGGGGASVLGGRSASTFLTKATSILAVAFLLSCLVLSLTSKTTTSVPTSAIERQLNENVSQFTPFMESVEDGTGDDAVSTGQTVAPASMEEDDGTAAPAAPAE